MALPIVTPLPAPATLAVPALPLSVPLALPVASARLLALPCAAATGKVVPLTALAASGALALPAVPGLSGELDVSVDAEGPLGPEPVEQAPKSATETESTKRIDACIWIAP
jgi:hypothetical protein